MNVALSMTLTALVAAPQCGSKHRLELSKAANVRYEFYQPRGDEAELGIAHFRFQWTANFEYKTLTKTIRNRLLLTIVPSISKMQTSIRHRIRLPLEAQNRPGDFQVLIDHEFDHVAISADERVQLLFRYIVGRRLKRIERILPANYPLDDEYVNEVITDEVDDVEKAIVKLIQANYNALDVEGVSDHGKKPIENRAAFFESLYSIEHLRKVKFPYVREVAGYVKTTTYKQAKRWYCR